ncbi:hypothetical protein PF010_g11386 [Phytophthora fragariae]|uniref:Uncharacterized protein n=1 Tax=Phytophthora fragariae TaxID=53985 RepID=A0A6G0L6N0_9STRA|nr:hypothetical protein PF010_g11386 [Phytophthora fragariae]
MASAHAAAAASAEAAAPVPPAARPPPVVDRLFERRRPHASVQLLVLTPHVVAEDALAGRELGGRRKATRHVAQWSLHLRNLADLRLHLQLLVRDLPAHSFEESF